MPPPSATHSSPPYCLEFSLVLLHRVVELPQIVQHRHSRGVSVSCQPGKKGLWFFASWYSSLKTQVNQHFIWEICQLTSEQEVLEDQMVLWRFAACSEDWQRIGFIWNQTIKSSPCSKAIQPQKVERWGCASIIRVREGRRPEHKKIKRNSDAKESRTWTRTKRSRKPKNFILMRDGTSVRRCVPLWTGS